MCPVTTDQAKPDKSLLQQASYSSDSTGLAQSVCCYLMCWKISTIESKCVNDSNKAHEK